MFKCYLGTPQAETIGGHIISKMNNLEEIKDKGLNSTSHFQNNKTKNRIQEIEIQ